MSWVVPFSSEGVGACLEIRTAKKADEQEKVNEGRGGRGFEGQEKGGVMRSSWDKLTASGTSNLCPRTVGPREASQ